MKSKKIVQVYEILFCTLCFVLPFEGKVRVIPNILFIVLGVILPFVLDSNSAKQFKNKGFLLFTGLLGLVCTISLFSGTFSENLFIIKKMVIVPVIYILFIPVYNQLKIQLAFVIGVLFTICWSSINILLYVVENKVFSFSNGAAVNQILITERVYLAFMAVLSIAIALNFLKIGGRKLKWLAYVILFACVSFILVVSAKMALISTVIIIGYNLIFLRKYRVMILGFAIGLLTLILAFSFNENLRNRFLYDFGKKDKTFIENLSQWEPRVAIWNCAAKLIEEDNEFTYLLGFNSFQKTKDKLTNCYDETIVDKSKRDWFVFKKYNSHNQFLDFLLSSGVIVLFLFIVLFVHLFVKNKANRIKFSLVIAVFMLTLAENYFHRQIGGYLFGFILILATSVENRMLDKKSNG